MRVLLDTNVLLSAIFTRGVCEAILDACIEHDSVVIVGCEHIFREFTEHATGKFGAPLEKVASACDFLRRLTEVVEPDPVNASECPDADDRPILGAAIAGRADVIVTGDAALQAIASFRGVPIVSPRAFLQRL